MSTRRATHGRCIPCKVILRWYGAPRLRDASCPRCHGPLVRTAANLARRIPVVEEHPVVIEVTP